MKRAYDLTAAVLGLCCLLPLLLIVAILIKFDSKGPVFFRQVRVGRGGRPFRIYKFRTMVDDARGKGPLITTGDDPRITRIGRFLRHTKLDEFPQLLNVLRGDMSIVGPRPEVPAYVELFRSEFEEILKIRPGITDVASLKYRNEAALLGAATDPEDLYVRVILPEKLHLAKGYAKDSTLAGDVKLILKTLFAVACSARPENVSPQKESVRPETGPRPPGRSDRPA
jgi:lipopolysaccharide/colanic/teichoic acid biosynthesis glycosyltransferase